MRTRRPSLPLVWSVAIHLVLGIVLANAAFHYDFSHEPHPPAPVREELTYVSVGQPAGALGDSSPSTPARATEPSRGMVAPLRVPTRVAPSAPAVGGSPSGVVGGRGSSGGHGVLTGIVPAQPDPRLEYDEHAFWPAPKTHAERVDSAIHATILAYNDSVATAARNAGRKPGDWTFEKNGQKWGVDGSKIYLGKFAIPSAVLAALPIRIQANPGESIADRLSTTRTADLNLHAGSQYHDDEFKSAVKRIRERKDRERKEKQGGDDPKTVASAPDGR